VSEYYGDQYDERDYGPALSPELVAALNAEYFHNRKARQVEMHHRTESDVIGALWWRGSADEPVITATMSRHRITHTVAQWARYGWHIDAVPPA
jgi:hypothetical protein